MDSVAGLERYGPEAVQLQCVRPGVALRQLVRSLHSIGSTKWPLILASAIQNQFPASRFRCWPAGLLTLLGHRRRSVQARSQFLEIRPGAVPFQFVHVIEKGDSGLKSCERPE
jgi:hypothetical protein